MHNEKKSVAFATLGCKVNVYDTEAMTRLFADKGYVVTAFEEAADIYIINTCTVTNLGDKKSRQLIRRAKAQNPNAVIAVCGCYAEVNPDEVKKINGVSLVFGTKNRGQIVSAVEAFIKNESTSDENAPVYTGAYFNGDYEELPVEKISGRTRAFIKIQDGCDRFCSYCIIPYARGSVRSRKMSDVIAEVNGFSQNGYKEIVLVGIHVASYGKDLENTDLLTLVRQLHDTPGIERIRFSSLDPTLMTDEFVDGLAALPKVCNHFHLSLQSGCDKTLAAMNRRYTASEYARAVTKIRAAFPDCAITTDMIVGFPGESDEDFADSYSFAEAMRFSKIHVFPFSPKTGTKAAGLPGQLPSPVKDARAKKLIALSDKMAAEFVEGVIGKQLTVLFERKTGEDTYEGHSTNYIVVEATASRSIVNELVTVDITERRGCVAVGTALD